MLQVQAGKHRDGAKYKTILPLTREEWEFLNWAQLGPGKLFSVSKPVLPRRDGFLIYPLKLPLLGHQWARLQSHIMGNQQNSGNSSNHSADSTIFLNLFLPFSSHLTPWQTGLCLPSEFYFIIEGQQPQRAAQEEIQAKGTKMENYNAKAKVYQETFWDIRFQGLMTRICMAINDQSSSQSD